MEEKTPSGLIKKSPIERLQKWREKNREEFEKRRSEGLRKSSKVKANLARLHRECKAKWKTSAMKNPKLNPTEEHIAAKSWRLIGPDGNVYEFRNLKKFVRDHTNFFDNADVTWKEQPGSRQLWCKASQCLSRLRPTCARPLPEWEGWKWGGEISNDSLESI